jgi:hypothetical protein
MSEPMGEDFHGFLRERAALAERRLSRPGHYELLLTGPYTEAQIDAMDDATMNSELDLQRQRRAAYFAEPVLPDPPTHLARILRWLLPPFVAH